MWTGSQAPDHWNHQSQRCPAGNGNAECFQHYNSCAQHCNRGAADGGFGGEKKFKDDKQAQNLLEVGDFAVALPLGTLSHLKLLGYGIMLRLLPNTLSYNKLTK